MHHKAPNALMGGSRIGPRKPLVSIVTAAYNAAHSLPATIDSVRAQMCDDYEYIVVDGASKDGSAEVLRSRDAYIDQWVSAPDTGMYDAMNKGAAMARGTYLAFLNADDRYLPHTVAAVLACADRNPDAKVIHGNMIKVKQLGADEYEREERPNPQMMPRGMGIFHPASFVRRAVFEAVGGYDLQYQLAADYAFFLQVWQQHADYFVHLDRPLAYFSLGGASNAGCGTYAEAAEIQRVYNTGYAEETEKLFLKCQRKMRLRRIIFGLARYTGTQSVIHRVLRKRWQD